MEENHSLTIPRQELGTISGNATEMLRVEDSEARRRSLEDAVCKGLSAASMWRQAVAPSISLV